MNKTIVINGTEVACMHEVKIHPATHQTAIHVTVIAGTGDDAVSMTNVHTIGSVDEPLPPHYGPAELQKDLDRFRVRCATMAESRHRAKQIAKTLDQGE